MKTSPFNPRRLDVQAFAKHSGELEGDWPLTEMARLADAAHPDAKPSDGDRAVWRIHGESRPVRGASPQIWLHLTGQARLSLVCQRCLAPLETQIDAQRSFLFVHGEDAAAELDADSEDDVLALTRSLDVCELLEDELLLALPLVPRHEVCAQPLLPGAAAEALEGEERPNPFAALARLRRGESPN